MRGWMYFTIISILCIKNTNKITLLIRIIYIKNTNKISKNKQDLSLPLIILIQYSYGIWSFTVF